MDGAASPTRPGCSAGWREKTRPARATRRPFRHKTLPTRAGRRHFRYKTRPARPKWLYLARFALAGRVLSRFCRQQAKQGEFSPAPAPPHHGHERNNTPTQHSKPRGETFSAPARHKQPKITHFHHAGANFLSTTGVKTKPTNSRMQFQLSRTPHQREIRRIPTIRLQTMKHIRGNCMRNYWSGVARRPEKSHVIRLDERSTKYENVAIPTI